MTPNEKFIEERVKNTLWHYIECIEQGMDVSNIGNISMAVVAIRYNAILRDRKNHGQK